MRLYFAPMEGITGYIYRNAHHRFFAGVDQYYTPFITPPGSRRLSSRDKKEILPENNQGVPLVPQVLTNRAEDFIWAAREIASYGYREVNLNLGCPSATVTSKSKGAGFLAHREELDRFLDQVFTGLAADAVSVSVKTRIGMESPEEFEELLRIYNQYPLKELIIHPRVRSDFYKGKPNLEVFRHGAKNSENPVCYNGDIFTKEDYGRFREQFPAAEFPVIHSVMMGRGAVTDPWLFEKLRGSTAKEPASETMAQGADKDRLMAFHDAVLSGYHEAMSGDRNTLFKMKELWFYMADLFEDGGGARDKYIKKIKKAQKTAEYQAAVAILFDNCLLHGNNAGKR